MPTTTLPSDELVRRYEVPGPRYTSYPTVPAWTRAFTGADYQRALARAGRAGEAAPLSLYVHIPFCRTLCTYCGCNVAISRDQAVADRYLDAVGEELRMVRQHLGARRRVTQLHWGGGSPTFLSEEQIRRLWSLISNQFEVTQDAEISFEANPVTTTASQLAALRELGFNRISIGVQDFDPQVQRAINRHQTLELTRETFAAAQELGFSGINVDLVYGLPHQTAQSWERTLEKLLELRPHRLAAFAFAFLPSALPHQRKLPVSRMPRGPEKLHLMRRTFEATLGAGYVPVGMDHFALPEDPLARALRQGTLGRGFQGYTVTAAPDLIGVGVSAISDVAGAYAQNAKSLQQYQAQVVSGRLSTDRGLLLGEDDLRRREIIAGLMCRFRADLSGHRALLDGALPALEPLAADGLVEVDRDRAVVQVTPLGRWFVRNAAMAFDAYLSPAQRAAFSQTV
ncbi:MAG TPA: oxygen-independent coproporphyrinogen III oxidase [Myxococcales bacterium]|nr:oxygen-independent coproporphyrinogen III oxidase [Myxococcales bacterium]